MRTLQLPSAERVPMSSRKVNGLSRQGRNVPGSKVKAGRSSAPVELFRLDKGKDSKDDFWIDDGKGAGEKVW